MNSRRFAKGSARPERSTRRSATVTNSVPLASRASRISSLEANFPVPTNKREVNSRSAILSFDGLSAIAINLQPAFRLSSRVRLYFWRSFRNFRYAGLRFATGRLSRGDGYLESGVDRPRRHFAPIQSRHSLRKI